MLDFYDQLLKLIPRFCQTLKTAKDGDFTRKRLLPLPYLLVSLLHLSAGGSRRDGVDIRLGAFFKLSRRSGLWPNAQAPHRSALTHARAKLGWEALAELLSQAVALAYRVFPQREEYTWCGLPVFAFDGCKFTLPATAALRREFDPDSGLDKPGKGHYPQALGSTVYDVFRRLPVGRLVGGIHDSDERSHALRLLELLPALCVCLFDRGYPAFGFILALLQQSRSFIMRCPASSTFPAVESFIRSGQRDGVIYLLPSDTFKRSLSARERRALQPVKLRIVRLAHPDGTLSVLLTNLFDKQVFTTKHLIDLYYRRWAIENHYRDEKVSFEVERFHSKTPHGIRQELFAVLITCVIARTVTALSVVSEALETAGCYVAPQLKNAVKSFAADVAFLAAASPEKAWQVFQELVENIRRVKYYKPKKPPKAKPRVNKSALNKWQSNRGAKVAAVG